MSKPDLPKAHGADNGQSPDAASYSIGYRRPPLHTRFKPGRSGNDKGRPRRQRNVRTVVEETLNERIKIREGNRTRSVTKLDAMILSMTNAAVSGNPKSQAGVITLMRSLGMTGDAPDASPAEPFTADDSALIDEFLRRHEGQVQPTEPPESAENPGTREAKPPSQETKS